MYNIIATFLIRLHKFTAISHKCEAHSGLPQCDWQPPPDPTNPSADRFQYRARGGGSGEVSLGSSASVLFTT